MVTGKNAKTHQSIRRHILAFMTLFNNIHIHRRNKDGDVVQTIHVPISFADKAKWYRKRKEDKLEGQVPIAMMSLPRMYADLPDMAYDPERQLAPAEQMALRNLEETHASTVRSRAPWNYMFELGIGAENLTDALAILEQILPYFTPTWTVEINDLVGLDIKTDLPVTLKSGPSRAHSIEGNFDNTRMLVYTIMFEVKGHIYQPVTESGVIMQSIAHINDMDFEGEMATVTITAKGRNPEDGVETTITEDTQS